MQNSLRWLAAFVVATGTVAAAGAEPLLDFDTKATKPTLPVFGTVFSGIDTDSADDCKDEKHDQDSQDERPLQSMYGSDKFDGSEFDAPTFEDSNFGKQMFRGSFKTELHSLTDLGSTDGLHRAEKPTERNPSGVQEAQKKAEQTADKLRAKLWNDLVAPVPGMLTDWVPDKVDKEDNGGFTTSPDNGSPVPYHLNGHPNLDRGLPWEAGS